MKRVLLMAVAAVMLLAPAANAQKVNESGIRQKLEKSDAEINDVKKNVKAATWLNRAKTYFESIQAPTKDLFPGFTDQMMLKVTIGSDPVSVEDNVWVYPWVKIHFLDGRIAWEQTREIYPGAIDVVLEALEKAHELDPKQDAKIKSQIETINSFYQNLASVSYDLGRYDLAYESYRNIAKLESNPAYGAPEGEILNTIGTLAAYLGAEDPSKFVSGEEALTKALAAGYTDEEGNIYYYLFHCYYGQKEQDPSKVMKAKEALLEGIEKFPKNERILDGLMSLYTAEEGVGDPADLISLIDKALADDPTNSDLWFGRGRVYYKLNNFDECINSFAKVVEINPDSFDGNYYLALFYMAKGDKVREDVNARDYKSQSEYDAAYQSVLEVYKDAVPWFEKALALNPTHLDTVDCLKSLCARRRDESPEYMEKFTKYTQMYNDMH